MAKKKISKSCIFRLISYGVFSLCLIIYFIFVATTYSYRIVSLRNQEKELQAKLEGLTTDEKSLKTEITKLNDPEYVASYAREHYQYSRDGEYIIQINQEKTIAPYQSAFENLPIMIPAVMILGIVTIKLIRKK